jgi:hypothetical protein
VGNDAQRCGDAQRNRRDKRGSDNDPVRKVVECISDEKERAGRPMNFTLLIVAVSPDHQLLQDEEEDDPDQHGAKSRGNRDPGQSVGDEPQQC